MADSSSSATVWDESFLMANAIVSVVLPRETPRWWIQRRNDGTWQDLIIDDDATDDYFHGKLRMTRGAFYDIVAACTPFLQRSLTHYRTPLLSEQLVAFALYRWASGETFESATSSFGMGRSSGIKVVRDVTNAILSAYSDKIAMPTEAGTLFLADAVDLSYGVRTRGYILADNAYGPLPWLVVPYGRVVQPPDEAHLDTCHKSSRNVVERAFGRLKGMWRLFLRHHKTNMENLPQQFTVVCILHNLLIKVGIEFDEHLLVDRDVSGNKRLIDLGMHEPATPVSQDDATDDDGGF
ncbi:hypothetical protein CBR_g39677 [Chara braunii]|uniref:DDE Tnp4 domain-containing protein n=1 Tax=Chara braunii TaxID=69332 RepID=A0A388K1H4_CHABU|nr:hypothetical protein CBR_g39677 [Chara braunii]|eukprot:GBG63896.1 hypothetical protein CBR_g39677 [Chara braunii]